MAEHPPARSGSHAPRLTTLTGCPFAENKNSLTAGRQGPGLLQDTVLIEKLQQFDREKIPARNVHALGTGAYGHFTVTHDISRFTKAAVFARVGKTTPVFSRLSGVFTEQGDSDTVRDVRGLAVVRTCTLTLRLCTASSLPIKFAPLSPHAPICLLTSPTCRISVRSSLIVLQKFYTEEGNWDVLCTNFPVFGARDAKIGPDVIHAFKRDPRTAEWFPTQTWDFIDQHPEGLHQALMLYSDRGTPLSYRHQHFYACNTYRCATALGPRARE